MATFYPERRWTTAVGLPVGRHASLPGVRSPLPAHRLVRLRAAGTPTARRNDRSWPVATIDSRSGAGDFAVVVHEGPPRDAHARERRRRAGKKSAASPRSAHSATTSIRWRSIDGCSAKGSGETSLLVVADLDERGRQGTSAHPDERGVRRVVAAARRYSAPRPLLSVLPAVPDEGIAPATTTSFGRPSMAPRPTATSCSHAPDPAFVRLARVIADLGDELAAAGVSAGLRRALTGYAAPSWCGSSGVRRAGRDSGRP